MLSFYEQIGSGDLFRRMLVFDALTANTDRHKGNHRVIFNTDTLKLLRMAPVFDHNQALLPYAVEEDFNDMETYLSGKAPRIGNDFVETASLVLTSEIKSDLKNLRGFTFDRNTAYSLPE